MATRNPGNRMGDSVVTESGLTTSVNAIELLKQDHRQVEEWFAQFTATDDAARKEQLAADVCKALEVHAQIEEEIFYPAFVGAGGSPELHHEAIAEHDAVRAQVAKIRHSPGAAHDDHFDADVRQLATMVEHHVQEEEGRDGMFGQAASLGMDLDALGARLEHRKVQLMDDASTDAGYDEAMRQPDGGQSLSPGLGDPDLPGGAARR